MIFLFSVQIFFDPLATEYLFAAFSYSIMDMFLFNIYQLVIVFTKAVPAFFVKWSGEYSLNAFTSTRTSFRDSLDYSEMIHAL